MARNVVEHKGMFWADQLAKKIIERAKKEGRIVNIKCQQTPSGAKHIGNLNDVLRAYFPYKAILERGYEAEFVHTTDDRDPLKNVPKKLADLDGNWHESAKLMKMDDYLGAPLCRIPDPFGCCKSWSEHFTEVWMRGLEMLGVRPKLYSVDKLYKEGKFEPYIRMVFEKRKRVGEIVAKFQKTKSKDYIPFDAICPKCGKLANVDGFDLKSKKVHFVCGGKSIKKRKAEGCGYEGWVPWSEGKLQWRFEWPALWAIFHTTFEPFGKDHAEGSWKSGIVIAREIFEIEPPIPYVYEFFLVNGEKMSASVGNVYIVQDMMKIMEPEVFLMFYTKKPGKQRDLDLKNIYTLVDEFDRAERIYFGSGEEKNEHEKANLKRMYELVMEKIPEKKPIRIPYTYASVIYQCHGLNKEKILTTLKNSGHIPEKISKEDEKRIIKRIELAGNWVKTWASERYKFNVKEKVDKNIIRSMTKEQVNALIDLREVLKKDINEQELYNFFWKIAEKNNIKPAQFFKAAYKVLIGKDSGPKLAPFILAIGKEKVSNLLKEIESF